MDKHMGQLNTDQILSDLNNQGVLLQTLFRAWWASVGMAFFEVLVVGVLFCRAFYIGMLGIH